MRTKSFLFLVEPVIRLVSSRAVLRGGVVSKRNIFMALALGGCLWSSGAWAQQSPQVEWRVRDRFRLFDRGTPEARSAAVSLMDRIAAEPESAPVSRFYPDLLATLASRTAADPAASLRRSNYEPADQRRDRTSGRYNRDYLWPAQYSIEIRVPGAASAERCSYASLLERVEDQPCRDWTPIAVQSGLEASRNDWRVEARVDVVRGASQTSLTVAFRDELVVALGDSYISGEGNPDRPSSIVDAGEALFQRFSWTGRLSENQVRLAEWWDEPCHRSLLSWPVLAGIAHAARNPHSAVTLVHLGCSGAVAPEVDRIGQRRLPGGGRETAPQLEILRSLLLKPAPEWGARRVDTAFVSIGGNDVGFGGVIATLALPPNGFTLGPLATQIVGAGAGAVCPYRNSGVPLRRLCSWRASSQERLERLPGDLRLLASNLRDAGIPPTRTFQPLYPNSLLTAEGTPCDLHEELGDGGFEALMGIVPGPIRGFRFRAWNFQLQFFPESPPPTSWNGSAGWLDPSGNIRCDWSPEGTDSEICQALWVHASLNRSVAASPWQIVTAHLPEMALHGMCNADPAHPRSLPLLEQGQWRNGITPNSRDPYSADSPRWFRLANDSALAQFGFYRGKRYFHQGTVHPTFRGHAELAEAVYRAAFSAE